MGTEAVAMTAVAMAEKKVVQSVWRKVGHLEIRTAALMVDKWVETSVAYLVTMRVVVAVARLVALMAELTAQMLALMMVDGLVVQLVGLTDH